MTRVHVIREVCTGCGLCRDQCLFDAITLRDGWPVFGETCTLCGVCARACPVDAIAIERLRKTADLQSYRGIWCFIELDGGGPRTSSLQVLSEARRLAEKANERCSAVIIGGVDQGASDILVRSGAHEIIAVGDEEILSAYDTEAIAHVMGRLVLQFKPNVILFSGTYTGRDVAPRIAARVGAGLTADCTALDMDSDRNLIQVRPTYGGSILATILCLHDRPQMATVRPNIMKVGTFPGGGDSTRVRHVSMHVPSGTFHSRLLEETREIPSTARVEDADIVVSGGRGVGSAENFRLLEEFADTLRNYLGGTRGVAVGASRSVVDEGWMPHRQQIGQTGKVVAPALYIACGISGASQHLIGMRESHRVVAINKDRGAPIFKMADLSIVGDLLEIIPRMIQLMRSKTE